MIKNALCNLFTQPRWAFGVLTLGSIGGICFALYEQDINYVEPCPMCIMQRVALIGIGIISLIFCLINPRKLWLKIGAVLVSVSGLTGVGIAARQLWLQSLPPDQVPACGPGLKDMLEMMPFWDVMGRALKGTGDCAKIDWTLFGLSMPFWSGLFMLCMVIFTWVMVYCTGRVTRSSD